MPENNLMHPTRERLHDYYSKHPISELSTVERLKIAEHVEACFGCFLFRQQI